MIISLIRTLFLYAFIILAIRIMGKRQISELQTSELVVTLLISDIAAIPMQNTGQPLVSGFIPILVLISLEILISAIMVKNSAFRKFICGKPIILINNGKIDQTQMRKLRMTTEDLFEQLRLLDIFSIRDIEYAIVETNGKMSVFKKPDKQEITPSMLSIKSPDSGMETSVISDGEILDSSLSICGVTKDWIYGVLKGQNLEIKDVFIMTANKNKDFYIIRKEDKT